MNILNSLIGSKNIENDFDEIVNRYPETLKCVPLLLAVRESEIYAIDGDGEFCFSFKKANYSIEQYKMFMRKTGLFDLLENHIVSNLVDYARGVETGLDSNGCKNRGGHLMENLVESHLTKAGFTKGSTYFKEMKIGDIEKKWNIKKDNLRKFKNRLVEALKKIETDNIDDFYFTCVIDKINRKIVGLEELIEQENGLCPVCGLLISKRSWIGYFMMIDDVRLLRNIDTVIRKVIYDDYHRRTKKHLRKKDMLKHSSGRLKSIEQMYYLYKREARKYEKYGYCKCRRYFDSDSKMLKVSLSANQEN